MLDRIHILGDPHLGRRFTKGVPLDGRGEREAFVRQDFVRQLSLARGHKFHICMGDLFDKPQVSYADLQFAYRAYREAAETHLDTIFIILQGNHDDSRDLEEVTAWDVFCDQVRSPPRIWTVTQPMVTEDFALFPWHPTKTAAEMIAECAKIISVMEPRLAFGHWDVDPRSAPHNLIATKELAALGITTAYTGHVHKPDVFERDGVTVHVVGSMQPYAQGEDGGQSDAVRYETVTLERLQEVLEVAPEAFCNACVRLQLQPGEQFDGHILCRSFDVQRMRPAEEVAPTDVSLEGFDLGTAVSETLNAHDIIPTVREKIDQRWLETFSNG